MSYKTPLRYPGGKQRAAKMLSEHFPKATHYIEPCVGGGSVFCAARESKKFGTFQINDVYKPLIDFYRAVQHPYTFVMLTNGLSQYIREYPTLESRRELYDREKSLTGLSDYGSAIQFFLINRMSFSGTTWSGGFSPSAAMDRFTQSSVDRIRSLHEALNGAVITNQSWEKTLEHTEDSDAFIFLDPPYYTASKLYGKNGSTHAFDHYGLSVDLYQKRKSVKFLITYDDCEEIRKLYTGWTDIIPFELQYGMVKADDAGKRKKGSEILIKNY